MYETKSLENCLRRWWYEAHYSSISSQTTIYGLTKLSSDGPTIKFLIASIESGFFSFEYQKNGDEIFIPLLRKLLFENVPQPGYALCFINVQLLIAVSASYCANTSSWGLSCTNDLKIVLLLLLTSACHLQELANFFHCILYCFDTVSHIGIPIIIQLFLSALFYVYIIKLLL